VQTTPSTQTAAHDALNFDVVQTAKTAASQPAAHVKRFPNLVLRRDFGLSLRHDLRNFSSDDKRSIRIYSEHWSRS